MNSPFPHSDSSAHKLDARLADAIDEVTQQIASGQSVDSEELCTRYAEVADQLRELLPIMAALDEHGPSQGESLPEVADHNVIAPETVSGVLGDFRIVRELGRGGMGIVYEAEQISLQRQVAVKVLPFAALFKESQLKRFQNEARAAAMLKHPHIVSVHFVGCDRGVHYYAMELIRGRSLADYSRAATSATPTDQLHENAHDTVHAAFTTRPNTDSERKGQFRAMARLGLQAAEALHYAHEQGVVHRDVKPSNLLLDEAGSLHVADFGLAQIQSNDEITLSGQMLGTLRYMSPEQIADPSLVDRRTDIYALGVTLYELLAERAAFAETDRAKLARSICELDPPPLRKVRAAIPADLATIVERAMSKERERRYRTAGALAEDLQRFLDQRPILARPVGRIERLWRWCQRSPAFALAIALAFGLLLVVTALSIAFAARESLHRGQAQARADEAEWQRYISDMHTAMAAWEDSDVGRTRALLERHRPTPGQPDLRGFEWDYLWRQCQDDRLLLTIQARTHVRGLAFSHDGKWIATASDDGRARVWDTSSGRKVHEFDGGHMMVTSVAFSHTDTHLFVADVDGLVDVWELETGKTRQIGQTSAADTVNLLVSPDGKRIAIDSGGQVIRIWDADTGAELRAIHPQTEKPFTVFTSVPPWHGGQLWIAGSDSTLRLWDIDSGTQLRSIRRGELSRKNLHVATVSTDARVAATAGRDNVIRIFDLQTERDLFSLGTNVMTVRSLAFSPDSRSIASSDNHGKIVVWDLETRQLSQILRGHAGPVRKLAYSNDGRRLASHGTDFKVNIWDVTRSSETADVCYGHPSLALCVAFSPNGRTLASGGGGTEGCPILLWDVSTGKLKSNLVGHSDQVWSVAFSPDGKEVASTGEDGTVRLWDLAQGSERSTIHAESESMRWVDYSRDGREVVGADRNGKICVWDRSTGALIRMVQLDRPRVYRPSLSPDGRFVAAHAAGTVVLLDYPSLTIARRIPVAIHGMWSAVFSGDGQWLAICHSDHAYLLDMESGQIVGDLPHASLVDSVDFSPDGRFLVTSDDTNEVHVWDVHHRAERARLRGHDDNVGRAVFSPDGKTIASASVDGTVRLWRSTPAD